MKPKPVMQAEEVELSGTDPTEFSSGVIRVAVSQICKSIGFKAIQISALELVTDVAARHLQSIGRSAVSFANASNRVEPNVFDIVNALNDLNLVMGFRGASNLHKDGCNLLHSGAFSDLIHFVECSHEIPFAKPISHLSRLDSSLSLVPDSVKGRDSGSSLDHIPRWLPDFPDSGKLKQSMEELDRLKRRKYELWGDAVSSRTSNGCSMMDTADKKTAQTKNGKQMGKVKFKINNAKKGRNGRKIEVLLSSVIDEEIEDGDKVLSRKVSSSKD